MKKAPTGAFFDQAIHQVLTDHQMLTDSGSSPSRR